MALGSDTNAYDLQQDKAEFNLNSSPLAFRAAAAQQSVHLKFNVVHIPGSFPLPTAFTVPSHW